MLRQLRDVRLVGARSDGAQVDWLLCADGRFRGATTSDGSTGASEGRGWRVTGAKVKRKGAWFEAVVEAPKTGWKVAVGHHGARWLAAVAFGTPVGGEVERRPAGRDCR